MKKSITSFRIGDFLPFMVVLFCFLLVTNSIKAQEISINVKNVTLKKVLKEIEKQADYTFVYNNNLVDVNKSITFEVKKMKIIPTMSLLLKNTGYDFKIVEKQIIISPQFFPSTQKESSPEEEKKMNLSTDKSQPGFVTVSGKVVSSKDSEPVSGAIIMIAESQKGTMADKNGNYTLQVPITAKSITVSFLGYDKVNLRFNPSNTSNFKIIELTEVTQYLNEVVVQGYGSTTKKDATGSVSRLTSGEIATAPIGSSIQSMLQGRAAGVNVMIQSASPTAPISVMIRGVSTLSSSGTQPLWVIDGVPDYSNNTTGDITNSLYNLNLSDLESIDILKDASATAIYGSRGANGVIIVTTKKGVKGQAPTIDFNVKTGIQTLNSNNLKTLNLEQYKKFIETIGRQRINIDGSFGTNEKLFFDESQFLKLNTSEWTPDMIKLRSDAFMTGNTNWWNEMIQQSVTRQMDVSVRGGTESSSYFISFGNTDVTGMVKGGKSKLYTGRLNFETYVGKALKLGVLASGSTRTANNKDNLLKSIPRFRPDIPAYNADGSINIVPTNTTIESPFITLLNRNDGVGVNLNGTGYMELKLLQGLKFKSSGTINFSNSKSDIFLRKGTQGYGSNDNSRSLTNSQYVTKAWDNTLNYAAVIGKHDIVAVLGQSVESYNYKTENAYGEGFPDEEVLININSAATTSGSSDAFGSSLASFFARVNYKYMNRYLLTATYRADGSSKFGPNNRWGYFPSGALAWIITEEKFMESIKSVVPYIKVRASMGKSGSQNLGYYDWMSTLTAAPYTEQPGIKPYNLGNPSLQWESATLIDLGIDFGLLNERVRGTFGYYSKKVDNLIYLGAIPTNSSYQTVNQNVGSITNNGWEFDIKGDIIKNKDLTVELGFNIATNKSIVNKLDGIQKEIIMPYYYEWVRLVEGGKLGEWYGYKSAGRYFATAEEVYALKKINATTGAQTNYRVANEGPGDPYILDQNGDGVITKDDRVSLGNFNPKFYGGFNLSVNYKNLYATANFSYSYGAKRLWNYPYTAVSSGVNTYNAYNNLLSSWNFNKDPMADIPRIGMSATYTALSEYCIYDASYIRLNSINLNYRLPKKWFTNKFISNFELSLQASNLFTITKYPGFDPQGNFGSTDMASSYTVGTRSSQELIGVGSGIDYSAYPSSTTYSVGLKVTFK